MPRRTNKSSPVGRIAGAPTDLNIFALASLVLRNDGDSTFSNRLSGTDYPHIKRAMSGGLVTASSPTTLTLTEGGRGAVLGRLRRDLKTQEDAFSRDPSRFDARAVGNIEDMRRAIERLDGGATKKTAAQLNREIAELIEE